MPYFSAKLTFHDNRILEFVGPADITKENTDAIVNAANSSLLGGGGVDGAIHRAGGPAILEQCKRIIAEIKYLPEGMAVITTGGRLAARYVIHTVGPIYQVGNRDEAESLASCYRESIRLAEEHGLTSLAFPAISAGAFGYPVHEAAEISVRTISEILPACKQVQKIRFVLFDVSTCKAFIRAAEKYAQLQTPVIFEKSS